MKIGTAQKTFPSIHVVPCDKGHYHTYVAYLELPLFFAQTYAAFDQSLDHDLFSLIHAIDDAYCIATDKTSFSLSANAPQTADFFAKCFFLCHRAFLSAAMTLANKLPDEDGVMITRRALEGAQTCLAVKADPANLDIWQSFEQRHERWTVRNEKTGHPKPFRPQYKKLDQEPLNRELQENIGALSDLAAHFTPEFFFRCDWKYIRRADSGYNVISEPEPSSHQFESGIFLLISEHSLIFRVFDRCQDGAMLRHPEVAVAFENVQQLHCSL